MNLFKKAKTFLVTALCATLVASGALAVNAFASKTPSIAATGDYETVKVSNDIQTIITALNASLKGATYKGYASAKYVKNYQMANGGTASGILVERPISSAGGTISKSITIPINLEFNVSNLTGNDAFFGVILSPNAVSDTFGGTPMDGLEFGLIETDSITGFSYLLSDGTTNGDGNILVTDNEWKFVVGEEKSLANMAIINNDVRANIGYYYPDAKNIAYGTRGFAHASFQGYNKEPYKVFYDYETNVAYKDTSTIHQTSYYRFANMLNVNPNSYANVNFDNKYCGLSAKTNTQLTLNNNSNDGSTKFNFDGFKNGKARLMLRIASSRTANGTFLITHLMGLDLSNPENEFEDGIIVDEDKYVVASENLEVPAPKYETAIGNETQKTFAGTVNVYKGERAYKYAYGSYGAEYANATAELGEAVATDLNVGDTFPAEADTVYTLEYIENGKSNFVTLRQEQGATINLTNLNTTTYVNGKVLKTGDKVARGDVIKVVANDGYTIYDFKQASNKYSFLLNNTVTYYENDSYEYTITEAISTIDTLTLVTGAYKNIYNVKFLRMNYPESTTYTYKCYEGVDSIYYKHADSAWRNDGSHYGNFRYDGSKAYFIQPYGTKPANLTSGGYNFLRIIRASTFETENEEYLGVAKFGNTATNGIKVSEDIVAAPLYFRTKINSNVIKTQGTVGLSVEFLVNKEDYDAFMDAFVYYRSGNELGFQSTYAPNFQAIAIPERHIKAFDDIIVKSHASAVGVDPYRYYDYAIGNQGKQYIEELEGMWSAVDVTNFGEDKEVDGVMYKNFNVTIRNIKLENYASSFYIGAWMGTGNINGGEVIRISSANGNAFTSYNVLETAKQAFANINTEVGEYEFVANNGVAYYSDVYEKEEIERVLKFYYYGVYLNAKVTTTETENFRSFEHNGTTYYYDSGELDSGDVETAIKYALDVIKGNN